MVLNGTFRYLSLKGEDLSSVEKSCSLRVPSGSGGAGPEGWGAGISVKRKIGEMDVVTAEAVREAQYGDYLKWMIKIWRLEKAFDF